METKEGFKYYLNGEVLCDLNDSKKCIDPDIPCEDCPIQDPKLRKK